METDAEAGGKTKWKLLFCPFCQYLGSNDPSYLNYIIYVHYNANYWCGKCLDEVFITGQQLSKDLKGCKGLMTDDAKEKLITGCMAGAPSSSSGSKKKKKHKTKSQQFDLQQDSQTLPPTSSKVSLHMSPHCGKCTKKKTATATPKKSHSSGKDSGEKHLSSHKHSSKKDQRQKSDKHKKMKK